MDFEILIDEFFLKLAANSKLEFAENKKVLSLINDFEDKAWRYEKCQRRM